MNEAKARKVFAAIRQYYKGLGEDVSEDGWIFRDHTHEDLEPGSWSLACEGYLEYDWPHLLGEAQFNGEVPGLPEGVFLEPINGCALGIYDE